MDGKYGRIGAAARGSSRVVSEVSVCDAEPVKVEAFAARISQIRSLEESTFGHF
jgi:hypothetical protein